MKISDALVRIGFLCIETAPFIYFVERYPAYVDKMRVIFRHVNAGHIDVLTSAVTLTEALTKPLKAGDKVLDELEPDPA